MFTNNILCMQNPKSKSTRVITQKHLDFTCLSLDK